MPIPDFQSCMLPLLRYVADGQSYRLKDAVEALSKKFELSSDERSQMLPSKGQTIFENRVAWARSYLKQAQLLEYPQRGFLRITTEGKRVISSGVDRVDTKYLKKYPSFQAFQSRTKVPDEPSADSLNPDELEDLLAEFAEVADKWFAERLFVIEYWKFMLDFFEPGNLNAIEWSDIQKLGDHIHSLETNSLARARAFGTPNYPIPQYRESFQKLAHGSGDLESRMRWFLTDDSATSKYLGASSISEILGQLHADTHVFFNKRDEEAARFLGIKPTFARGDDAARRFVKFNQAVQPVFQFYRERVGPRTAGPIGLEVDQFFSWLYETKELGKRPQKELKSQQRVWEFAPGRSAVYWEIYCRDGIAALGWNEVGDLRQFKSRQEIADAIKREINPPNEPRNDSLGLWQWFNEVMPGDLILAKHGRRTLIGMGVVEGDYEYRPDRPDYHHVRKVRWEKQGMWQLPKGLNLTTKTLTNLTPYPEHVAKLMSLIDASKPQPPEPRYWWVNYGPSQWDVVKISVGDQVTFQAQDTEVPNRKPSKYLGEVHEGDEVLVYVTAPTRRVQSLLRVKGVLEEEDGFECEVMQHFNTQPDWDELKRDNRLIDCEPLSNSQGRLFSLTEAEFNAIRELTEGIVEDEDYTIEDAIDDLFMEEAVFRSVLDLLERKRNVILQGPPGVGKTFVARRIAFALMGEKDHERVRTVQFHQSYSYEDFVRGYRPTAGGGFTLRNGIFYEFCERARTDDRPYIFIIDEINRGNLSKIFGELMMLIEHDKRLPQYAVPLVYQNENEPEFYVPGNVYVIGLMNTADRSLAMVDYALRRRFSFVDIGAAFGVDSFNQRLSEICGDGLSQRITQAFLDLNHKISLDTDNLGPGFCIGHSYFCLEKTALLDGPGYRRIIETEIAPLLREYWFDQPRIAQEWIERLVAIAG